MSDEATLSPLFTWRSAVVDSGLPPTSRHVALTLSLHMNERGGSAYPSVARLAAETGLDDRTVRRQLGSLVEHGWLQVIRGGGRSKTSAYTATVPSTGRETMALSPASNAQRGAEETVIERPCIPERGALVSLKGGAGARKGGTGPPEGVKRTSERTRRTRLPEGWSPSLDLLGWAAGKHPTLDLNAETEKFRDHHASRGSVMIDWDAAWRNWVRKAEEWGGGRQKPERRAAGGVPLGAGEL